MHLSKLLFMHHSISLSPPHPPQLLCKLACNAMIFVSLTARMHMRLAHDVRISASRCVCTSRAMVSRAFVRLCERGRACAQYCVCECVCSSIGGKRVLLELGKCDAIL